MRLDIDRVAVAEGSRGFKPTVLSVIGACHVATQTQESAPGRWNHPEMCLMRPDSSVAMRRDKLMHANRGLKPTATVLDRYAGGFVSI